MKQIKLIATFVCSVTVLGGCEGANQNVKPTTLPAPVAKFYPEGYATYYCGPEGQKREEGNQDIPDSWVVQVWPNGSEVIVRGTAGNCSGKVTFPPGSKVGTKIDFPTPKIYAME